MLLAAAVCPTPPFLVDGVGGRVHPLPELAEACAAMLERVAALAASTGTRVVVIGDGPETREWPPSTGFSADAFNGVRPLAAAPELPLALGLGRQLAAAAGLPVDGLQAVSSALTAAECRDLGAALVAGDRPVVLVVMADGSARRTEKAPGYFDPRADGFDRAWVEAVAAGEAEPLLALDPALAEELWCSGRAALQVLAGAALAGAEQPGPAESAGSRALVSSQVAYEGAPFGVQYLAASWELTQP